MKIKSDDKKYTLEKEKLSLIIIHKKNSMESLAFWKFQHNVFK